MLDAIVRFLTTRVRWWKVWATIVTTFFILWLVPEAVYRVWICIFVSDFLYFIAAEHYKK